MKDRFITLLPGIFLVGLSGCIEMGGGVRNLHIWAVPDWVTVSRDAVAESENAVFSEAAWRIRLQAAVNETVACQIILKNISTQSVTIWGIRVSDLTLDKHTIPADQNTLYLQQWITVQDYPSWYLRLTPYLREKRDYPDPLIPLTAPRGALPINLAPNQYAAVWLDLHVPPGTEAGIYTGQLRISDQSGTGREMQIQIEVFPFALPQSPTLMVITGLNAQTLWRHHLTIDGQPYSPQHLAFNDPSYESATAVLDETARLLHEHRCIPVPWDIQPQREFDSAGVLRLDWTDYDRLLAGFLDGTAFDDRMPVSAWPLPITENSPNPDTYGGWHSVSYRRLLIDYLRQCAAHFREQGWMDRHFVWLPVPGSARQERYKRFEWLGKLVAEADTRMRLVSDLTPYSLVPYGKREDNYLDIASWVSIWSPPASLLDPREMARQLATGKTAWLLPDRPPYAGSLAVIAPSTDARSLAWTAKRFGLSAVMIPKVNAWPEDGHPTNNGSENMLLWPGKAYGLAHPIPSVRLKRLLRGIQDYEYLWLMDHNGRQGIARLMETDLVPFGGTACYGDHYLDARGYGWVSDGGAWMLARQLMARELRKAIPVDAADPGIPEDIRNFAEQIEWMRFSQTVRNLQLQFEGLRMYLDEQDRATPIRIEGHVWLLNATREPVSGRLEFADLPEGWRNDGPPVQIENLQPLQGTRAVLRAKALPFQVTADGFMVLKAALLSTGTAENAGRRLAVANGRLCLVNAQPISTPLTLDGRLDDWPLAVGNTASDFMLVGAADVPKQNRFSPAQMSQRTQVFVGQDREYLHIAFNCADDRLEERQVTRNNFILYDELWPTGEDLIEVVLDPGPRAIDAGDLFHIIVKANGAVISERGIPCLAEVAPHAPWSAGITAAVDDQMQDGRWTVEIRIPLAALHRSSAVWGINFARYHARSGEYGSWSAARRYLYNPYTLGNIHLAR